MKWNILMATLSLIVSIGMFAPQAEATERAWINPNDNYGPCTAYLKVNVSDNITITWKAGTLNDYPWTIYLWTSTYAMNYSDNIIEGDGSILPARYPMPYNVHEYAFQVKSGNAPQSAWIRVGSYDVMRVDIPYQGTGLMLNFSVQHETPEYNIELDIINKSLNQKIKELEDRINRSNYDVWAIENMSYNRFIYIDRLIDELKLSIQNQNNYINTLLILIDNINKNQSSLRDEIYSGMNDISEAQNETCNQLSANLTNLTNVLQAMKNDTMALEKRIGDLVIPNSFNDTEIWLSIQTLSDVPRALYQNNTTVLNSTENPITYINMTRTIKENQSNTDTNSLIIASISGAVLGMAPTPIYILYFNRKQKLQEIIPPEA